MVYRTILKTLVLLMIAKLFADFIDCILCCFMRIAFGYDWLVISFVYPHLSNPV